MMAFIFSQCSTGDHPTLCRCAFRPTASKDAVWSGDNNLFKHSPATFVLDMSVSNFNVASWNKSVAPMLPPVAGREKGGWEGGVSHGWGENEEVRGQRERTLVQ